MIKDISTAWKDSFIGVSDTRFYFDPRQREFPHVAGSPTFTVVDAWRYGSHDMTGGFANYLLSINPKFVFEIKIYPNFNFDVASDQPVLSWDFEDNGFRLYYDATLDKFVIRFGQVSYRYIYSQQFDDGSSFEDLNQWLTITGSIDLTTGTDSGSELYINHALESDTWDDAIEAISSECAIFCLRGCNGSAGDYKVNYFRYLPGILATAEDVLNGFKNIYSEEIFWDCNGVAVGRSRCNISKFVASYNYKESLETRNNSFSANVGAVELYNEGKGADGCFSDDQYADFVAEDYQYNGTVNQKYLQNKIPLWIESWYGNDFDSVFRGKITSGAFKRQKNAYRLGRVNADLEDMVGEIAAETKRRARAYENYSLCNNANESASLLHTILRLATKREVYNYSGNSGFESASLGWDEESNVTITRVDKPLLGSYAGQAEFSDAGVLSQTVTFLEDIKLNVDEHWTYSIYLNRYNGYLVTEEGDFIVDDLGNYIILAEPFDVTVRLAEADAGGVNASTTTTETIDPDIFDGWKKYTVTHKITDPDSDRLKISIETDGPGLVLMDVSMLTYGKRDGNWFVLNSVNPSGGIISADRSVGDGFDAIGFMLTNNAVVHPWVRVEDGDSVWEYCKDIAHATPNLQYFGMTADNVFEYAHTPSAFGDPATLGTVQVPTDLAVNLEGDNANRIIISGCKITKEETARPVWTVMPGVSGVDSSGGLGQYKTIIMPGGVWPDPSEYGDYYGEVEAL